ncbi:hypothetical protein [Streptomyces griseus]|uniref:hypothetical protein n=1 Tax=Streptomyces griseus TaxID=1911 RepID=UPI000690B39A|nr:hypothetical protein [Streptomyces griseus]
MRRRAGAVAAGLLLAAAAATGCGIQGSDVVEAGGAPTVALAQIPESRILLYFLGPDGELMPVSREVRFSYRPVPERTEGGDFDGTGTGFEIDADHPYASGLATVKVLAALLAGPRPAESRAGLATELPAASGPVRVETGGAGGIRLQIPFPARELSGRAVSQLVCTAAYAVDSSGTRAVTVAGPDGALPDTTCPAAVPPADGD